MNTGKKKDHGKPFLIHLPKEAESKLREKAKLDSNRPFKHYMQKVLIEHAENPFKK